MKDILMATYQQRIVPVLVTLAALTLAACATHGSRDLQAGLSSLPDVLAVMGEPAMRWQEADGRLQLAYPQGPYGLQTLMVFVAPNGRLERIETVLDPPHFARIVPGKSNMNDVLKLIGPSPAERTMYFKARDELVWEWPFCDAWHEVSFYEVLFDATTGVVRSSFPLRDDGGRDGEPRRCVR